MHDECGGGGTERELQIRDENVLGVCVGSIDSGRGYGFLRVAGATRDIFVNAKDLTTSSRRNVATRSIQGGARSQRQVEKRLAVR